MSVIHGSLIQKTQTAISFITSISEPAKLNHNSILKLLDPILTTKYEAMNDIIIEDNDIQSSAKLNFIQGVRWNNIKKSKEYLKMIPEFTLN